MVRILGAFEDEEFMQLVISVRSVEAGKVKWSVPVIVLHGGGTPSQKQCMHYLQRRLIGTARAVQWDVAGVVEGVHKIRFGLEEGENVVDVPVCATACDM